MTPEARQAHLKNIADLFRTLGAASITVGLIVPIFRIGPGASATAPFSVTLTAVGLGLAFLALSHYFIARAYEE